MATTFEPGQYHGRVIRWGMVRARSENKTAQFALTFLPLGRFDPQNPDGDLLECPGIERTIFRPITENTAAWLLRDLRDLFEYPHDDFTPLLPDAPNAFDFHDKEFTANLHFEEFEGKVREKWNFATGGYQGEPMTLDDVRKLTALYGAAKPATNGKKSRKKPPADASAPAPAPATADVPI